MTTDQIAAPQQRKVGFLLGLGIFLIPIVFVWFLLRKGHSTLSRVLGFGWLALCVIAVVSSSGTSPSASSNGTAQTGTDAAVAAFKVGDSVELPGAAVQITSIKTRDTVGGEYMRETASDGGVLVVVTYSLTNTGSKPLQAFMQPDIKLVDAAGVAYDPDIAKTGAYATEANLNTKIMSDLNPGVSTRGAEVFEVGKTRYDPTTWRVMVDDKKHLVKIQ